MCTGRGAKTQQHTLNPVVGNEMGGEQSEERMKAEKQRQKSMVVCTCCTCGAAAGWVKPYIAVHVRRGSKYDNMQMTWARLS